MGLFAWTANIVTGLLRGGFGEVIDKALNVHISGAKLILLGTICLTIFALMLGSVLYDVIRTRREQRSLSDEEGEMLQQIWQGAQKMDDRITNLEAIVMNEQKEAEYDRGF